MTENNIKTFVLAGVAMKRLLSGEETNGQFCLFENRSDGNTKTPIHVHADDDETIYMIDGALTAIIDRKEHTLTAGDSIFMARGIPHQLMNMTGRMARYILVGSPSLFDAFVEDAGYQIPTDESADLPSEADVSRLKATAPQFGITLLSDWPAKS
ncbi:MULTISPECIES: cupin domain-containing protein [Rhizobium]|uniref:Cupin domain-containing protein n=1 Tax=Rhizobium tropici TaxID=398 RepID=A0A6P1CE36_RHITR|nr:MULTISPECIES: cupin domain-containing protein [Rhizobium]AGB73919.1 cupin 2 conserved barrel domain-containing protein [Rhizobium tropici CIAT 899]MBB4245384.1 putative RmlC-like cupin family protein [Rhizobium tropici]MBB5596741.1 putative RmlC-like cupin family protein [Rhizobium tropici]MBB6495735.1 putative RmlC-like cupin family protein [Rhizobium tropici]NEV15107.1 cupin domain-containing protein [Rhizobium tropici]